MSLAACGESQRFGLDRIDRVPYTGQHGDGQETGGWSGSSTRGWCGGTRGEHGRHRCDGTGSERGDAEHRAAGHGRILRGFRAEFGGSVGGRDTDAGGSGSSRPVSEEQEDVEQRVEIAAGLSELTSSTGCYGRACRTPTIELKTSVNRIPNSRTRRIVISWTVGVKRAVSSAPAGPRFERLPPLGEVASAASNPPVAASPTGSQTAGRQPASTSPAGSPGRRRRVLHRPRTAPAAAAPPQPRHRITADSWCGRGCSIGQMHSEHLAAGHHPTASEPTPPAPAAFLPPSYLPDPRRSRPRRAPKLPDPPPGRRHPEHSRRMLSASRHPSTTASPDSASEEYCTVAVPVMTLAVSARDSQNIKRARISTAPSGRRNAMEAAEAYLAAGGLEDAKAPLSQRVEGGGPMGSRQGEPHRPRVSPAANFCRALSCARLPP